MLLYRNTNYNMYLNYSYKKNLRSLKKGCSSNSKMVDEYKRIRDLNILKKYKYNMGIINKYISKLLSYFCGDNMNELLFI